MDVSLVSQPYRDQPSLSAFLLRALNDPEINQLRICVAWAKKSGLHKLAPFFTRFAERGDIEMLVGVSEGGATRQGLLMTTELATRPYVVFDPSGRTFHPKLYFAAGPTKAMALIGSNNLTAGGLYRNYEVAVDCVMDLTAAPDRRFNDEINQLFDRLIADTAICKPLEPELISQLLDNPRYRIGDETSAERTRGTRVKNSGPDEIFGKSAHEKGSIARTSSSKARLSGLTNEHDLDSDVASLGGIVVRRWWKKLQATDALQPPGPRSKITGNLRLTKEKHPIDKVTYFRQEFFGLENWTPDARTPDVEYIEIPMEVKIRDTDLGLVPIRVDYNPKRISNQGNIPTVLKWGRTLTPILRATSHIGDYAVVEQLSNGTYVLRVQTEYPGDFIR
jgi:hypothetical protein